ncbi:MAG TPA: hypothetical protein VNA25_10815 [Phycisphaerae bacterium]|nr:hypothetical protein [Phycisphaerae bacterium]
MSRNRTVVALVALVVLAAAPASFADPITELMEFEGVGLRLPLQITYSPLGFDRDMTTAGQMRLEYKGDDYLGYCVDLAQYAGDAMVEQRSPLSMPRGDMAAYLFETYASSVSKNKDAAALQAAIWEVLNEDPDNGWNIDSGQFSVHNNNSVKAAAQVLLDSLPDSYTPAGTTTVLYSPTKQDMMISLPAGAVPEPCAMVLMLAGGVVTFMRSRRRAG